jgi:hypothetical protein
MGIVPPKRHSRGPSDYLAPPPPELIKTPRTWKHAFEESVDSMCEGFMLVATLSLLIVGMAGFKYVATSHQCSASADDD